MRHGYFCISTLPYSVLYAMVLPSLIAFQSLDTGTAPASIKLSLSLRGASMGDVAMRIRTQRSLTKSIFSARLGSLSYCVSGKSSICILTGQ